MVETGWPPASRPRRVLPSRPATSTAMPTRSGPAWMPSASPPCWLATAAGHDDHRRRYPRRGGWPGLCGRLPARHRPDAAGPVHNTSTSGRGAAQRAGAAVRLSDDRSEMRLQGDGVADALYGDCDTSPCMPTECSTCRRAIRRFCPCPSGSPVPLPSRTQPRPPVALVGLATRPSGTRPHLPLLTAGPLGNHEDRDLRLEC